MKSKSSAVLVMQTEAQDTKIQERDDRILGLLDQIANNMVQNSDAYGKFLRKNFGVSKKKCNFARERRLK